MAEHSVVAVYRTLGEAEAAVRALHDGGFPIQQVSLVAQQLHDERRVHGYITAGDVAAKAATAGAWVGGVFGMLAGSAFVWVPGFGWLVVAGSLTALLAGAVGSVLLGGVEGAVAGAAVCGLLGWLVGLGISREHIPRYEEAIQAGKVMVVAHGPEDAVEKARAILAGMNPEQLDTHAPATA